MHLHFREFQHLCCRQKMSRINFIDCRFFAFGCVKPHCQFEIADVYSRTAKDRKCRNDVIKWCEPITAASLNKYGEVFCMAICCANGRYLANHLLSPDAVAPGDYRLGDRHWITSVVTGSDRERTAAFSYALPSDAGRAISPPGERTDIAGISASVYCCPPYGVIITSAGNGDREEFSLEFLLHRSSVTGQFQ